MERHPAAPGRAPARSAPQPQRSWLLDLSSGGSGTEDFPFSVWAKLMRRVLSEEGEALLRTSYMATHTEALLDEAMDIIGEVMAHA